VPSIRGRGVGPVPLARSSHDPSDRTARHPEMVNGYSERLGEETLQPKARKISANAGFNQTASPCIIRSGVRATSSEYWPRLKIPPPSSLDGRVGSRSPSEALNTSGSYKPSARSTKAVGLPSPRNLGKKLIVKQRALVVYLYTTRSPT
jgi:hypothetical protein